jgi:hypothetical protein
VHKAYSTRSIVPMPRGKPSPKRAITVDPEVHGQVLAAAAARGVSISAWMTDAARRALRQQDGLAAIREWERQFGALTEQETDDARGILQTAGTRRRTRARRAG